MKKKMDVGFWRHVKRQDGLMVFIVTNLAVHLFSAELNVANKTPVVLSALVAIWTKSITLFCMSSAALIPNFSK